MSKLSELKIELSTTVCGKYRVFGALGLQWAAKITDGYNEDSFKRFILEDIREAVNAKL